MTPLKSTITTTTAALALLLLLLVLVPTTVEAKKKGKAARLEMHGDRTIDVQPFDDDPTEFNCRLHDTKHGKATKGNPQYCETAGGASIMVIESYDNEDDEDDEDRRSRVLKGGAKKKPKKYVTSIIDSESGNTYYIDEEGEVTQTHTSEFPSELDAPEVPAAADGNRNINQDVLAEMQAGGDGRKLRGHTSSTSSEIPRPSSSFLEHVLPKQTTREADEQSHRRLDDGRIIDIMVIWTPAAEAAQTAANKEVAIRNVINDAIEWTNLSYDNSGIDTMLRLVHAQRAEGYVESSDYSQNLYNLTPWHSKFDGSLSWVEGVRNEYGADFVAMIVDGGGYCGIAWLGPSSTSVYSVTSWGCAGSNLSFAHEVGHNMGCNHDKGTKNACSTSSSNYGYRDPAARYRSVLAYGCTTGQCDNNAGGSCSRKPFFSHPDMLYEGNPMGSAGGAGTTTGVTNNAMQINDNRVTFANYRQTVVEDCQAHSECNDGNSCTVNTCDVVCQTEIIPGCCGNGICEASAGENTANCYEDCRLELITTMAAGNGQKANMFNIDVSAAIEIKAFNINCDVGAEGGGNTVRLWHKTGTYNNDISNSGAWTQFFASSSITCNPSGVFTPISLPTPLSLEAGPHAFLVYNERQLDYTNGSSEGNVYQGSGVHPEITFYEGIGKPDEFGTTKYTPRIWNGKIEYAIADLEPTSSPTKAPTGSPTASPSKAPTSSPTKAPTGSPTASPSKAPTSRPTTSSPTESPTSSPTPAPTPPPPTRSPTASPTKHPSSQPSASPTSAPSTPIPTESPTSSPTKAPTTSPSKSPSHAPTTPLPTKSPSASPSMAPTASPSQRPSSQPSASPTPMPSSSPSSPPTDVNECLVNNGGCDSLTTCTNIPNGRVCGDCPSGYTGTGEDGCVEIVFAFTDTSDGFMVTSRASVDPDPAADSCWGYSAGDSDHCTRDVPLGATLHNFIWADWMVDPLDRDFRKAEYEIKVNGERNKDVLVFVPDAVKGNSYQLHVPLDELSPVPRVGDTVTVKLKIELDSGAKLQTQHMPLNIVDLPPEPTSSPTKAPTGSPTSSPTKAPTTSPSKSPSQAPTRSAAPTMSPSEFPTAAPVVTPSPTKSPSQAPTRNPTAAPTTSCTLPTGPNDGEWLITTTDGCTDRKVFDEEEEITLIFFSDAIDHSSVDKIEVEFKVEGDSGRKTKFKLDSAADLSMTDPSFPRKYPDGTYRLTIRMSDIGRIGGWDGGITSPDNDPIRPGEWTTYKFKVEDAKDRHDIQRSDLFRGS